MYFALNLQYWKMASTMISKDFEKIFGTAPQAGFGDPFMTAFKRLHHGNRDEIEAAAYICSLFLSSFKAGMPTEKLHLFVHHIHENYKRFSFDCRMYDRILKEIGTSTLQCVALLDTSCRPIEIECCCSDITEALDFYTNR